VPPWAKGRPKPIQAKASSDQPSNVRIDARGVVTWTNPLTNPWKDLHHQAERDYTGGEYTPRMGRAAVEMEYRGTDRYGYLCPNARCSGGYCHYRATVNASICPNCGTAMYSGSHEVYAPGQNFVATQWYLLQIVRWAIADMKHKEVEVTLTENELVDLCHQEHLYSVKRILAHLAVANG
jgi:hypothetical protein